VYTAVQQDVDDYYDNDWLSGRKTP